MRKRPIIMGAESVRAILEGRKTQTRRVIKPQPRWGNDVVGVKIIDGVVYPMNSFPSQCAYPIYLSGIKEYMYGTKQPYGIIGDRLWVRETWAECPDGGCLYKADPMFIGCDKSDFAWDWKSSMFMPRWASRITLEITDIRVERVQDITEEDAIAEGIEFYSGWEEECGEGYCTGEGWMDYKSFDYGCSTPKDSYCTLWDSLNAKRGFSWESNPWVWVLTFKVV